MEKVLIILGLWIFLIVVIAIPLACYLAHIDVSLALNKPYDWVGFKTFLMEFDKFKDDQKLEFDKNYKSIFCYGDGYEDKKVYCHASVICFDNKCMILYPISFFRYWLWKLRLFKSNKSNRIRGLFCK